MYFYSVEALRLILTADGSHSIYNTALDEHYHSTHGALQESRHVFIEAGLRPFALTHQSLRILEIGFGTGLNCLLSLMEAGAPGPRIEYTTLEPFPLSHDMIATLNYAGILEAPGAEPAFAMMHSFEAGRLELSERFALIRSRNALHDFQPEGKYNLIYFDAFAPDVQPELWTREAFHKLFACLDPGGVLVTYCAKGEVKRAMKEAGFLIERLPGPPGKREMTRARVPLI
jgi:tRNA U34 5-methylaminomethyl-2-thiouridine-forming methyltransferase MnmC